MLKQVLRAIKPNPLDQMLKKCERCHSVLLVWNRGLGDIALGVYAVITRIRQFHPKTQITVLTRANLKDGFTLLGDVEIIVAPELKRAGPVDIHEFVDAAAFDLIIEKPDPTQWCKWQLGTLTPKLQWRNEWNDLWKSFDLDKQYVGVHLQTETHYAAWRDWPLDSWVTLFDLLTNDGEEILLFGFEPNPPIAMKGVHDLRGKTELFELLSIIQATCHTLIVPDSGISSMTYFLDRSFPLHHITLWAEPHMGILKQNVPSPNPELRHTPLMGANQNIQNITPQEVYGAVCSVRQPR